MALFTAGEVVEAVDGDDDCVGPEEELAASSVGLELSLEEEAAVEEAPTSSGSPAPQELCSITSFMRSSLLSEQKACNECSSGAAGGGSYLGKS